MIKSWKTGLGRTRKSAFGRIASLLGATELTDETWDELEALLIQADLGVETSDQVIEALREMTRTEGLTKAYELRDALREELRSRLMDPPEVDLSADPSVVILVGVNGSGKTTSAAKLGKRYADQGKRVLLVAADTFRAGAIDQLQIWAERLDLPVILGQPEGDPGAVTYDAIQSALARNYNLLFVDTAGRLHTRYNLMEE
ncbi:MAG: signal recognition particle receptor subunit alpha, partial [Anaerolineales bacterium]|nr:signal recognition particle receptor subunit alpha [Anaerolineales bacterium]